MRMIFLCICLFLGTTVASHALAVPPDTNQLLQQNLLAAQNEVKQLKAELQVVQSYQDKFLATVYWALGTTAGIAVLLVGFGWFANFRIYERDKTSLKQELNVALNEELLRLQKIIETHVANSDKSIRGQIEKGIEESVHPLKSLIASNKKETVRKLAFLERDLCHIQREEWIKSGVHVNALRSAIKILELSQIMDSAIFVPDALDLIQKDLNTMLKPAYGRLIPDAGLMSRLNQALNQVGAEHNIMISAIRENLAKLQSRVSAPH